MDDVSPWVYWIAARSGADINDVATYIREKANRTDREPSEVAESVWEDVQRGRIPDWRLYFPK